MEAAQKQRALVLHKQYEAQIVELKIEVVKLHTKVEKLKQKVVFNNETGAIVGGEEDDIEKYRDYNRRLKTTKNRLKDHSDNPPIYEHLRPVHMKTGTEGDLK